MALDAYRTLGLEPGASPAEVKRAYRRLAKAFHPDSAGPAAIPRFLAIHEAYERLTSGRRGTARTAGAGSAGAGSAGAGGAASGAARTAGGPEPWRADPTRARQAREQARARGRASSTGTAGGARSSGAGARSSGTAGSKSDGRRAAGGARSAAGSAGAAGPASTGRRRAPRKATLGSTTYDDARDASDTSWAGASWYGPTSGEYWRVNPREYADPRKHGPEYQSRARRSSTTSGEAWDPGSAANGTEGEPAAAAAAGIAGTAGAERPSARSSTSGSEARASSRAWAPPRRETHWGTPDASVEPGGEPRGEPGGPAEAFDSLARLLDSQPRDPVRRLGYALVAWAPLGLVSAAIIGSATGCATFSASCTGVAPLLPWLAQAIILGLLMLLPLLARILATGSAAVILAMLPLTGLLLAFGGSGEPGAAGVLQVLLAAVWVIGVAVGIAGLTRARLAAP